MQIWSLHLQVWNGSIVITWVTGKIHPCHCVRWLSVIYNQNWGTLGQPHTCTDQMTFTRHVLSRWHSHGMYWPGNIHLTCTEQITFTWHVQTRWHSLGMYRPDNIHLACTDKMTFTWHVQTKWHSPGKTLQLLASACQRRCDIKSRSGEAHRWLRHQGKCWH